MYRRPPVSYSVVAKKVDCTAKKVELKLSHHQYRCDYWLRRVNVILRIELSQGGRGRLISKNESQTPHKIQINHLFLPLTKRIIILSL